MVGKTLMRICYGKENAMPARVSGSPQGLPRKTRYFNGLRTFLSVGCARHLAIQRALVACDEAGGSDIVAPNLLDELHAVHARGQYTKPEVERVDHKHEVMRLASRFRAWPVIGLSATGIAGAEFSGLVGIAALHRGHSRRDVEGDPVCAAAAARGIRIFHHDGEAFGVGRRPAPAQCRRYVLAAAVPWTPHAFTFIGIVLRQHAVVGKVGRRELEQIGMINGTRCYAPGEVSGPNEAGGQRRVDGAMTRDRHNGSLLIRIWQCMLKPRSTASRWQDHADQTSKHRGRILRQLPAEASGSRKGHARSWARSFAIRDLEVSLFTNSRPFGNRFWDYTVFIDGLHFTVTQPSDLRFLEYFYDRCIAPDLPAPTPQHKLEHVLGRLMHWME